MASSSITTIFPPSKTLMELTTDPKLIHDAVSNSIGRTAEKLDGLLPPLVSLVVDYLEVLEEERIGGVFGEKEWADHFGSVPRAPALHPSIEEIWQGPCPIYPERRISETHMFVYIPTTVNGVPLTLKSLGMLAKHYFPETDTGYGYILDEDDIVKQSGDRLCSDACWVLMTKEGIPLSRDKDFNEQKKIVEALAKTALPPYEVPKTLDAAVCILTRFASSFTSFKIRLFHSTYTRCQENVRGCQVIVGPFSPTGLAIYLRPNYTKSPIALVACLRKFF